MGLIARYFRLHPWQRRMMALSLTATVGAVAMWLCYDTLYDRKLVARLASADLKDRIAAIDHATARAKQRPALIRRLERTLDTPEDIHFSAVVDVLSRCGRFDTPDRRGAHRDRYAVISLAATDRTDGALRQRLIWLQKLTLAERDNTHVRRGAALAAEDPSAEVRAAAGALVARLGDDGLLRQLLGDADADVRAVAAIDAGVAERSACAPALAAMLAEPRTDSDLAAAAYALARLQPKARGKRIAAAIDAACRAGKADLLDKLLVAAALLDRDVAAPAVTGVLDHYRSAGKAPPAMAIVAGGKIGLDSLAQRLPAIVDGLLARGDEITVGETVVLAAAMKAGHRLKMPPDIFIKAIRKFWDPRIAAAMILAAEALGDRAAGDNAEAAELLATAIHDRRAPVAAAAAAVALFKLKPGEATEHLRTAVESPPGLTADYVAWNLPRAGHGPYAQVIAAKFFAPREYNNAVRCAGAMLVAMFARGGPEAGQARDLIGRRLVGGPLGGETDPVVRGSYQCALLMLGDRCLTQRVAMLRTGQAISRRRVLTALALTGCEEGFDHVLARARFHPSMVDGYLAGRLMMRMYAALAPRMPALDIDAPAAVRYWQARICREYYLTHRRTILEGLRK